MASPQKLHALTSLRFLAAAMILFHHTRQYAGLDSGWAAGLPWDHGVSCFFVLSGFILAYVYPTLETTEDVTRFWVARLARVWPVHACAALVALVSVWEPQTTPRESAAAVAAQAMLVHAWVPLQGIYFALNPVSWSVSTEVFFYMLFPLLVLDWGRTWAWKLALSFALLAAVVAFGNVVPVPSYSAGDAGVTTQALVYIHPFARLFEFTLGMASLLLFRRLTHWRVWTPAVATAAEVSAVALTIAWVAGQPSLGMAWSIAGHTGAEWAAHAGSAVAFALLIPVLAVGRGAVSGALAMRPMVLLGEISYSLYLLHPLVLFILVRRFPGALDRLGLGGGVVLWLGLAGVAWLSWACVEVPARRLILEAWDHRAAHAA